MDSGEYSGLDRLGEDLVLLSVTPDSGRIATAQRLGYGLAGSELVRLAAAGRITVERGRVVVQDPAPCDDPELNAALSSLTGARRQVTAKAWVGHPRRGIHGAYLARLTEAGLLQAERGTRLGIFPVTRWRVADPARVAAARAILDEVALSSGPASTVQGAYAGLAHAIGLGSLLYPGRDNRPVRKRLEQLAKSNPPAPAVDATANGTGTANEAAIHAAQQAAVQAAVQAATAAAIQAAVDAATAAAADGGGAHGHH